VSVIRNDWPGSGPIDLSVHDLPHPAWRGSHGSKSHSNLRRIVQNLTPPIATLADRQPGVSIRPAGTIIGIIASYSTTAQVLLCLPHRSTTRLDMSSACQPKLILDYLNKKHSTSASSRLPTDN
jgi:hypothetical protein